MKYIILFIFSVLSYFVFLQVFASEVLDFSVSPGEVALGEEAQLRVQLDVSGTDILELTIAGVENIPVFATSQGYSYASIGGIEKNVYEYILTLEPDTPGVYLLGPLSLKTSSGTQIFENKVTLEVGEQQAFEQSESLPGLSRNDSGEVPNSDIRGLRLKTFPFVLFILSLIGFIVSIFFLFQELMVKKPIPQTDSPGKVTLSPFNTILQQLSELASRENNLSAQEFSRHYNSLVRMIWNAEGYDIPESATLREIAEYPDIDKHPLFASVFPESYMQSFSTESISGKDRAHYIQVAQTYIEKLLGK